MVRIEEAAEKKKKKNSSTCRTEVRYMLRPPTLNGLLGPAVPTSHGPSRGISIRKCSVHISLEHGDFEQGGCGRHARRSSGGAHSGTAGRGSRVLPPPPSFPRPVQGEICILVVEARPLQSLLPPCQEYHVPLSPLPFRLRLPPLHVSSPMASL